MEIIGEIVIQVILGFLLNYPGAAIRWIILRGKKPFTVLKDDYELNYFAAMCVIGLTLTAIVAIRQL
jgi:hypothetical protein